MSTSSATTSFENVVIRASAGTGKTFQLSNRYLALIHQDFAADRILATTFTRKAAGEIQGRVLMRLANAVADETARAELGEFIGDVSISRERCLALLQRCVRNLHRLRIGTIDSFFGQLARSFGLELGLPPAWQIVDELEEARLRDEAIEMILQQNETRELLTLTHSLTKGEASRSVSELIRATVNSLYSLFQETNADAWLWMPRPKTLGEVELADALQDLRNSELPTGRMVSARDDDCDRASQGDWETFISTGLTAKVIVGQTDYFRTTIPAHVVAVYQRLVDHARATLIGRLVQQTEGTYELLKRFDAAFQQLKQSRQALRFDDITRRLSRAEAIADLDNVAFRLDAGVDHLLLDEFQDTSLAQWEVIEPFARRATSGSPRRSFFCVGDVKQAIYGWRGGIAEIFDALSRQLDNLVDQPPLTLSYRSSPAVIEAVNQIFTNINAHPNLDRAAEAVAGWREGFVEHSTSQKKYSGYACLATAPLAGDDENQRDATLNFAAGRIATIVQEARRYSVGVLVRRNASVGRLIYLLHQHGIHASEEAGNPLVDSAAVGIVLSLLRLADHPGDTVARFHVAHSPLGHQLEFQAYGDSAAATRLAAQVRECLANQGYGPSIYAWAGALAPSCNRRESSRLEQLVQLAYGYQPIATLRTDDFVRFVENQRISDPTSANVRVMTVHQAKGLEFDVVVLPELDVPIPGQPESFVVSRAGPISPIDRVCRYASSGIQQLLPPDVQKLYADATLRRVTEALCVLYVATTRAIRGLHMIISPSRSNERSLPRTFAGLLRAALKGNQPAPPETVLFKKGNPSWYLSKDTDKNVTGETPASEADSPLAPPKVKLAPIKDGRQRGLGRTSPSALEGGSTVKVADVFNRDRAAAMRHGTLIHAWFEQIEWLDGGRPDENTLRRVASEVIGATIDQGEIDERIGQFNAMLDGPHIAHKLSLAAYEPMDRQSLNVQNERPIAMRDGDELLVGSIDRLVTKLDGQTITAAEIIDFKTDKVSGGDEEGVNSKVDFYRPQMEAYRKAVAKNLRIPLDQIDLFLLFVGAGIVRRL